MRNVLIASSVAVALIAMLLGYVTWELFRAEQVFLRRPSVGGTVLSVALFEAAKASGSAGSTGTLHLYRQVAIDYEYWVEGRRYVGHTLSNAPPLESIDLHSRPSAKMSAYLDRYRTGTRVTVHYASRQPEQSLLEIDTSGSRWFGAGTAAAMALTLALLAWGLATRAR